MTIVVRGFNLPDIAGNFVRLHHEDDKNRVVSYVMWRRDCESLSQIIDWSALIVESTTFESARIPAGSGVRDLDAPGGCRRKVTDDQQQRAHAEEGDDPGNGAGVAEVDEK